MKNKKGFTLIELMIVVAILGIGAAMAIEGFNVLVGKNKPATSGTHAVLPPGAYPTNIFNTPTTPEVQVINANTIGFKGHTYKRID